MISWEFMKRRRRINLKGLLKENNIDTYEDLEKFLLAQEILHKQKYKEDSEL